MRAELALIVEFDIAASLYNVYGTTATLKNRFLSDWHPSRSSKVNDLHVI